MTQVVHPVAVCVGLLKTYTWQPEVRRDTSGSPCCSVCRAVEDLHMAT